MARADHIADGGGWFHALNDIDKTIYRSMLGSLPFAARVVTPHGRVAGFIHGDVEGTSFSDFCGHLKRGDYRAERIALLGRNRIQAVRAGEIIPRMIDVDHMFFGHTAVTDPLTIGNCSWIDTGLPYSGEVTLVDVDDWISRRSV